MDILSPVNFTALHQPSPSTATFVQSANEKPSEDKSKAKEKEMEARLCGHPDCAGLERYPPREDTHQVFPFQKHDRSLTSQRMSGCISHFLKVVNGSWHIDASQAAVRFSWLFAFIHLPWTDSGPQYSSATSNGGAVIRVDAKVAER